MRLSTCLRIAFLLLLVAPTLGAQLLEPSIQIGLRVPMSGELVVPVTLLSGLAAFSARRAVGTRSRVEPSRRVVGGAIASVGAARTLRRGGTVRVDAPVRPYRIISRWTDPGSESLYGAISSTPYSDVVVTLGWSPR